jgi:hypothetical protein
MSRATSVVLFVSSFAQPSLSRSCASTSEFPAVKRWLSILYVSYLTELKAVAGTLVAVTRPGSVFLVWKDSTDCKLGRLG